MYLKSDRIDALALSAPPLSTAWELGCHASKFGILWDAIASAFFGV